MNTLPATLTKTLTRLKIGLSSFYGSRFKGLVLYGSYARGDWHDGSDIDLLLLLEPPVRNGFEISHSQDIWYPIALETGLTFGITPWDASQFNSQTSEAFLQNAQRDAKWL